MIEIPKYEVYFRWVILSHLRLHQFKNHENSSFDFCDKINSISGPNGSGKTNILDAIYTLSNTKSYFNHIDQQLIQFGKDEYSLKGLFHSSQSGSSLDFDFLLTLQNKKKSLKKNGKLYSRLLEHIGTIQTVFITPYDISLVFEGSEERRKFIDFTISQIDKNYLLALVDYRKYLDQRNAFLKNNFGRNIDSLVLESFDVKISPIADEIHKARKSFISEFAPLFEENYKFISESIEVPQIEYLSPLNNKTMLNVLEENRASDILSQRTALGVHKDDIEFMLNDQVLKKFGSQGQIKSFVIALKIAQYQYFKKNSQQNPILLLDDIFEKIDAQRSQKLMERMCSNEFGQIFISDTHSERIIEHFKPFDVAQKHFSLVK